MRIDRLRTIGIATSTRSLRMRLERAMALLVLLGCVAASAAIAADQPGSVLFSGDFESGTVCAWSAAVGWAGPPCVALQIVITESGVPLVDGALFNRDVVPVLDTSGGTEPVALDATLDGAPFTSGSTVAGDALHLLEVSAEDADGFLAQRTVHFTIDTVGPVFLSVAPPEGFVTGASSVTLSGEVSGATALTVNGASVGLINGLFTSAPLPLAEGPQSFLLVATDPAGNSSSLARQIVRDSLSPGVTISMPAPGVVGSSPVAVAGTATDPHLAQVLVNGQTASVAGASFSLSDLVLVEGSNEIVAEAFDAVGNPPGTASISVTLDTQEPVLSFRESGLPLAEGAQFNRTVSPVVVATDATQVALSSTLNGVPFASGTPVADEGTYTLEATALDEGGHSAHLATNFVIDKTAPTFVTVLPPDNSLISAPSVTLSGEVAGGTSVTVDGLACTLSVGAFACPSFSLTDGERTFLLRARDAAGNETPRAHRIRRDGTGPAVVITTPTEGAYLALSEIAVAGTAVDPNLAEVRVNGVLANLVGDAWSAGPLAFAEGAAALQVTARDTVDNATVVARLVTIDTLAPDLELLESGAPLAPDALFNRTVAPVIAVADASPWTLVATLDGALFASATLVASEGIHLLEATATDAAGNSVTRQVSFRIDASPPALIAISPADGFVTAAAEIHLQGQVLGADALTIDGVPVPLLGDQFVSGPYPLAEGERTFAIVARDAAGNELSRTHRVLRDVTAPTVAIVQPFAAALVGVSAVQVTGQAADPHLVSVAVNGVTASISGPGGSGMRTWVAPQVPLIEGETTLMAVAEDRTGNSSSASRVAVRDSQAPTITITDPAAGSVVPEAAVVVSGAVDDPNLDRVTVQGITASVEGGNFSASVALVEGDNTLLVRATDRLGQAAEATRLVRRDSTAPGLEIVSPVEGGRIAATSVAVSGAIQESDALTLTVNGVVATIAGTSFSVAAVPLVEGDNRLIARARDVNGNEGVRTRMVVRDTIAPTVLGTVPPAGALGIDLTTVFSVQLSEEPGPASVNALHLETDEGLMLPAAVEIFGTRLRLTPAAPLPSSGLVRLLLEPGIVDLAGNPLAAGATFEFSTTDAVAPAAPTIPSTPARFLCVDEILLAGFAEAGHWVEAAGGAGAARVRAATDGAFSMAVPLIPGAVNRLTVTCLDDAGNRSLATEIEVVHDCSAPVVEGVEATPAGFSIQFSEAIDPASFAGSILVSGAAGAIDGSLLLEDDLALYTAAGALPEGAIRVEVLRQPRDLAGNLLAYSWVSVFGGEAAESFFVATVIDDAVGRPLAGAKARVLTTNGAPASGPALESTSPSDGALSVPVAVGTHLVAFERPGFVPVFRFVTTEAQQGADIVDPRLTPISSAMTVGPDGGQLATEPSLWGAAAHLVIPAGALADPAEISLTSLSEQGLPRLLPFGWSPRAAVWIGPEAAELLLPAVLALPIDVAPGSTIAWVHLDPETRSWRVEGVTTLGVAELELPVASQGAWAVVEADPPPFAVPAAVVGEPLGSLSVPPSESILTATLNFEPETVLPGQRSLATVVYTSSEASASGATVTLSIAEELQLFDGSTRTSPSFRSDVVVYRSTEGARSQFFLGASEAARRLPIELGEENVTVLPYGGESVRGNVLGPQGGSVLDPSGDRVDVPAGALVRPTPVQLESAASASLPLPVPPGFAWAGALQVDFSGETLLAPANLFLALSEPPAPGEGGILFGVDSLDGGERRWRPLATIAPSGSGWQSDAILSEDLAWPGVTRGGLYLFARALNPFGLVRGSVFDVGGGTVATALVIADTVDWIQLSSTDGRYAFPAWVGPIALTATKTSTGDQGSGAAVVAADERVDLDLLLAVVRPSVVSTTPASGAGGIPVGIEPVVQFSEPVERASLTAALTLRPVGGLPLAFDIHHLGAQVTLEPAVSLEPGTTHELEIGEGVRDLQGHGMAAPVMVSFTTQTDSLPSTVDLSRVLLYAPSTNGESRIQGLPGAAPAGTLVFVENLTRLAATVSVSAEQDGGFELSIVAHVTDRLLLHVLVLGANEVVAILGPFRTADGRGAYVGAEGATFTTIDGWTFTVPATAFSRTSVVHVAPRLPGQLPVALPASFIEGVSFALDFGDASPTKAIELALPAPAGAPAARPILVLREVRAAGAHGWMLHELALRENERLTTLAAGVAPFDFNLFSAIAFAADGESSDASGAAPSLAELAAVNPGSMLPGLAFAGNYTISWTPEPIGFLGFPTNFWSNAYVETGLSGIVTVLNGAIASLLESSAVLIPALLGTPVAVTVHDGTSGFVLYQSEPGDLAPPPGDGGIAEVPPEAFGDSTAPYPLAASPVRLFVLDGAKSSGGEPDRGMTFLFAGDGIGITGAVGSMAAETRLRLLGLDDDLAVFTTSAGDGSFELQATVEEGHRYLLAIGARIDATTVLEIEWGEPLGDALGAVRVLDDVGRVLGVDVKFGTDRSVIEIAPRGAWPTDRPLRLEFGPTIADPSGNRWGKTLDLDFRARASQVVGQYPFEHVYDVARLGSLLFVAAGQQGLAVLDASDPSELANVMPGGLTFPLPYSDVVRAVAVDPHGRVLVAGGGVANFGVLRVFDPLKLPEIVAAPDPIAARGLAWRGTTIVSDRLGGTGTQLPAGTPRRVTLYSDDLSSRWQTGQLAPDGLVGVLAAGTGGALGSLSVSGNGAGSGAPVTLRNLTRGASSRVDADSGGSFTVSLAAATGDRVELLRNRATIAYLATLGAGIEAVDVNAFYDGPNEPGPAASRVVGIYSGAGDPNLELCNAAAAELASALIDLDLLVETTASPPIDVAALIGFRGIAEIESPPSAVDNLSFLADACAEVEGSRAVRALAAEVDLPWDANADGRADDDERERDYAFVTHATGGLLVFDLTRRSEPQLVSRIRLPLVALGVAIDRTRMRAYVSGASGGLAIVDLAALATTTFVDADGDGRDDRVLEVVPIPAIQPGSPAVVLPDLGMVFVGGDGGTAGIQVGAPEIVFIRADGSEEPLH